MLSRAVPIEEILEMDARAVEEVPPTKRPIPLPKPRPFVAITGLRGSGKTTLLRQLRRKDGGIYISLDAFPRLPLYKVVKELLERGIDTFYLDEIHYLPHWEREIKKVYDFTKAKVYLTSSVAISLHTSAVDLTRRIQLVHMPPFNLWEYLLFKEGRREEEIPLEELPKKGERYWRYEYLYQPYVAQDMVPAFYFEGANVEGLLKGLERDLAFYARLPPQDVMEVMDLLSYLASSFPEDISFTSLAANVGITKYKARLYVELLEKSYIARVVWPQGSNVRREPKVLLLPPIRKALARGVDIEGALKEEFFVHQLWGRRVYYLKGKRGEKRPDFWVDGLIFEVGGKAKGTRQVGKEGYVLTYPYKPGPRTLPLVAAGFLKRDFLST